MSDVREMHSTDLLKLAPCNLDKYTETYQLDYYLNYLTRWPELCRVIEGVDGQIEAYILGKVEASPFPPPNPPYDPDTNSDPNYLPWHAHITALTVAPSKRRRGHATVLTTALEEVADQRNAWFVDLFVRADNEVAITLYRGMGYSIYRRVASYYADGEDAFDMRKPMRRDRDRKHVRERGEDVVVDPSVVW